MPYIGAGTQRFNTADGLTVTGDAQIDTTTLVVDAANNRVGIGTASPSVDLEIASTAGSIKLTDTDGSDKETIIKHSGGTFFLQARDGSSNAPIVFGGNGGGSFDEHLRVLSGGGLTFNGDTATANALSDYEEGTWTPTIGGTATYHNRAGYYIKIGKLVFITGLVHVNAVGTGATNNFQGLPYGGTTGTGREAFIGVQYFNNLNVSATYFALRTNGTQLYGSMQGGADGVMSINPSFITASTEVAFAGCYYSN